MLVLGICGSLRAASFNLSLLKAARELQPDGVELRLFDGLRDIPPFDQDLEAKGDPPAVSAFKSAIRDADALLFATPEYNYSVPGVLKNAIDWASRPAGKTVLGRKPAAIVGASMGPFGTARAQVALRQSFLATRTLVLPPPELLVARAQDKFDASGRLTDEPTRKALRQLLEALVEWTERFRDPA